MKRLRATFGFPETVDNRAARIVAAGVLVQAVLAVALGVPWLLVPLVYGFWARVLAGPSLSPLALFATRLVVPRLRSAPQPTPGPPKRFAQAMGAAMTTAALVVWAGAGWGVARWVLVALWIPAFAESVLGYCVGCAIFGQLMRVGLIPVSVCPECADVTRRHPELARRA
jgi:hypothetical protein